MRIMLAPMEGVIDHTLRDLLCDLGGLDRCVTEFVRVTERPLPRRVFLRYCPELETGGTTAQGVPVFLQLLGGQPDVVAANASLAADLGAPGIDLNFGCPAKTVNRSDGGSVILREPERVYRIVTAVRAAVPDAVPVTVKIRLGYEDRSPFLDVVRGVVAAGATELVIHARTKADGYRPPAYWEEVARAVEIAPIPVIANGEIWSPEDALACARQSGCDALMLGRGALCRPDLPRLVAAAFAGRECEPLAWEQVQPMLIHYLALTLAEYDARYACNPIKQWLTYLRMYYPQAAALFAGVKRITHPETMRAALLQAMPQRSAA
jgi:tRNA-dihydrouridine synthase C